jgi:hypothetical protein
MITEEWGDLDLLTQIVQSWVLKSKKPRTVPSRCRNRDHWKKFQLVDQEITDLQLWTIIRNFVTPAPENCYLGGEIISEEVANESWAIMIKENDFTAMAEFDGLSPTRKKKRNRSEWDQVYRTHTGDFTPLYGESKMTTDNPLLYRCFYFAEAALRGASCKDRFIPLPTFDPNENLRILFEKRPVLLRDLVLITDHTHVEFFVLPEIVIRPKLSFCSCAPQAKRKVLPLIQDSERNLKRARIEDSPMPETPTQEEISRMRAEARAQRQAMATQSETCDVTRKNRLVQTEKEMREDLIRASIEMKGFE